MKKFLSTIEDFIDIGLSSRYESIEAEYEFESCVLCGKLTNVRRDTHIDFRACYIEGCGQLCRKCFISLYKKDGTAAF